MQFEGAILKEQGITFAIVIVKKSVIDFSNQRDLIRQNFSNVFGGVPIILMAQNSNGIPTYQGRNDIVKFLSRIDMRRIPWKKYTV